MAPQPPPDRFSKPGQSPADSKHNDPKHAESRTPDNRNALGKTPETKKDGAAPLSSKLPAKVDAPRKAPKEPVTATSERLGSLDAFRGLIMIFLASSGFGLSEVYKRIQVEQPDSVWRYAASQVEHVPWQTFTGIPASLPLWGFSLWDMIQPAFMFMVGVAAPFSLARRQQGGHSYWLVALHALWRAVVLVLLGVFLSSNGSPQTNWGFMNVLSQIGLGYLFVFLLVNRPRWLQVAVIVLLLAGHAYLFVQHPLPPADQWAALGVTDKVEAEGGILTGILAPWSEHINVGNALDRQFLNLFPREKPFEFNSGGYQTINFISSTATMLIGLLIGQLLRSPHEPRNRLKYMLLGGAGLIALALVLHFTCCPIVKRIWTPSWTLYSGGVVIWMLAALYAVIDVAGWKRWAFPLIVVGMNSIAIYLMGQLMRGWTIAQLKTHLRVPYDALAGWINTHEAWPQWPETLSALLLTPYGPIYERLTCLLVFWLICLWMYRQRFFIRV